MDNSKINFSTMTTIRRIFTSKLFKIPPHEELDKIINDLGLVGEECTKTFRPFNRFPEGSKWKICIDEYYVDSNIEELELNERSLYDHALQHIAEQKGILANIYGLALAVLSIPDQLPEGEIYGPDDEKSLYYHVIKGYGQGYRLRGLVVGKNKKIKNILAYMHDCIERPGRTYILYLLQ